MQNRSCIPVHNDKLALKIVQNFVHHKLLPLIYNIASAEYKVVIRTSEHKHAGSDSDLYYSFVGTKGNTSEYKAIGVRRSGRVNTWVFTDNTDIGEVKCISIRMVGGNGWIFTEVCDKRV